MLVVLLACVTVASYDHCFGVQRWERVRGASQLLTVQLLDGIVGIVWEEYDNAAPVPPTPVRYTLMIDAGPRHTDDVGVRVSGVALSLHDVV